jgi:hypothetical protein
VNIATRILRGGYRTPFHQRQRAARRRKRLAELRLCITAASHGEATDGVRCANCAAVHRASADSAKTRTTISQSHES